MAGKWLKGGLATGVGVLALAVAKRRMAKLQAVAPGLRSLILVMPFTMNGWTRLVLDRLGRLASVPKDDGIMVTTHQIPRDGGDASIRLLTYERRNSSGVRPVLFWIHGGGYVTGRPEQDQRFIAALLARFDIVVASVDYRLAPAHPFPIPLDDCHAALAWTVEHAAMLEVDRDRVAIGGQSAGGGLAAALVQRVADHGPVTPVFQLLVYPMLDAATVARPDDAGTGDFIWTRASNRYGWQSYLGCEAGAGPHPDYAVPAERGDLSGLPPAWIGVGSLDLFLEEDRAYAARLQAAGVACELHVSAGAYHAFDVLVPDADESRAFTTSLADALGRALGTG